MRDLKCLRCGAAMRFIKRETFQLGKAGWILGDLPHLIKGGMELELYSCPGCGKVELFQVSGEEELTRGQFPEGDTVEYVPANGETGLPQVKCPVCGNVHDFDYGRCPFCKHEY